MIPTTCRNCKSWQGTKYSEWADCYSIVLALNPALDTCSLSNEFGTILQYFKVPFDPHDVKYWNFDPAFRCLYDEMTNDSLDRLGIRVEEKVIDDVVYDRENGERVGRLKLKYFQTHKEFTCENHKAR